MTDSNDHRGSVVPVTLGPRAGGIDHGRTDGYGYRDAVRGIEPGSEAPTGSVRRVAQGRRVVGREFRRTKLGRLTLFGVVAVGRK
jgi:hypothetical protein